MPSDISFASPLWTCGGNRPPCSSPYRPIGPEIPGVDANWNEAAGKFDSFRDADPAGRITSYNQAAVELWGCRPELGKSEWCGSWRLYWPDGRTMATLGFDEATRLWDVASRRQIRVLHGHRWSVEAVAFSPDGRILATGSGDATVKLWDVPTGRELATLSGHGSAVRAVAFSPDGRTLATGGGDRVAALVAVADGAGTASGGGPAAPAGSGVDRSSTT